MKSPIIRLDELAYCVEHPWDRQPDEPAKLYSWFEYFYRLDPKIRDRKAAYVQIRVDLWEQRGRKGRKPQPKSAPEQWTEAYQKYNWEERAALRDDFIRKQRAEQERHDRFQRVQQRRDRRVALEERAWGAMERLIELAEEMARSPLYTKTIQDDGRTIIVNPAKWSFRDISTYYDTAMKMGKLAAGLEAGETEELKAIETLVNAGWYGDDALDRLAENVEKLKQDARAITDGKEPPKEEITTTIEASNVRKVDETGGDSSAGAGESTTT